MWLILDLVLAFTADSKHYAVAVNSIKSSGSTVYKSDSDQFTITPSVSGYQINDTKNKLLDYDELYWFVRYDAVPDTILLIPAS